MKRIAMRTPLVEMLGDEMTRIMWEMVKESLVFPFVDLKTEVFDLGIEERDRTRDEVTVAAAHAIKRLGVGVKCATITPNADRVSEYGLKEQWLSPNATLRSILDGTVFRKPILIERIPPVVRGWKKPIIIGRHAFGDVYKNAEIRASEPGMAELVFTSASGHETRKTIATVTDAAVFQGMHNTTSSIRSFARACFEFASDQKVDLLFGAKDTISKTYDGHFKEVFQDVFKNEYEGRFQGLGLNFTYTLIDDAVARIMKSEGGLLWACKNYDGDVMSDMVASAFGSLALMTSVLVSPDGCFEYEAAHGTVQQHYYRHRRGEPTSTNSIALIFAWTGALRKRGELDALADLVRFADALENAVVETVNEGAMTADLARIAEPPTRTHLGTESFIRAVAEHLGNRFPDDNDHGKSDRQR